MRKKPIHLSNNIHWNNGKIKLSPNRNDNFIVINGLDYRMRYLDSINGSKGGNSSVFLLINPDEPDNEEEHLIIKFCNSPVENSTLIFKERFRREKIALLMARRAKLSRIITIHDEGQAIIDNFTFPFYTMEKGDCDLAKYLNQEVLSVEQKLLLCMEIIKGFKELHGLRIYHRDIKHDNLFLFSDECKIGDLGLIKFREEDAAFLKLEKGERIGPFGWESPETMNKYLTEKNPKLGFDCEIDHQSDIFQLGKLFWYVFQGNLPIGQVAPDDFLIDHPKIFTVIVKMLQQSKINNRRPNNIDEVERLLMPIAKEMSII